MLSEDSTNGTKQKLPSQGHGTERIEFLETPSERGRNEAERDEITKIKQSLQETPAQNDVVLSEPSGIPVDNSSLEVRNVHRFYKWFAKYYDLSRKIWNPFFPTSVEKEFN